MTARLAIGIDVGGTKMSGGLVDLATGELSCRLERPTPLDGGGAAVLDALEALAQELADDAVRLERHPMGLGVGLPELVTNEGTVASRWNFDWSGLDPQERLGRFGRVRLESDVRAAALAELRFGEGRRLPSFVFVTIGSGMSFCLCTDGKVHRGANGFAIHFASSDLMVVSPDLRQPFPFRLEAFASGFGLADAYARLTGSRADARAIVEGRAGASGQYLLEAATTAIASYVGQMVNMLDPHGVVIGGGLGTAAGYFERIRDQVPAFVFAESCRGLPVCRSALGADAGIIGAAAAVG